MDMIAVTPAEQEYLKQIYLRTNDSSKNMHIKELASLVSTKPASVSDMIKKLAIKGLVLHNNTRKNAMLLLPYKNW